MISCVVTGPTGLSTFYLRHVEYNIVQELAQDVMSSFSPLFARSNLSETLDVFPDEEAQKSL